MKKRLKATGIIKSASRASNMGKAKPAWSDNFLAEFHEEAKARKTDESKASLYNR